MKASKWIPATWFAKATGLFLGLGLALGDHDLTAAPDARPAPGKGDLAISLTARKVVKRVDGHESLVPADRAFPGEVIQYDALYVNQSAKPLSSVLATLPIPNGMVFVPDSATPAPAEASLDGKKFEPIPIWRQVRMPNGEEKMEETPATEYRALRWNAGDLAVGGRTAVSARTRVVPAGKL